MSRGQALTDERSKKMEETRDMTEKEMQTVRKATLYDLRLIFTSGEKKQYSTEELVELLDKIALAKEQE
jgi:hypothetical protein